MDSSDLKISESCRFKRQMVEINSKWLAENITEMEERLKDLLEWIEEDGSFWKNEAKSYSENKSEFIANMEDFCIKFNSLAASYGHLTGEMKRCGVIVDELKDSGKPACISEQWSPLLIPYQTPYQKMDVQTPYLNPFEKLCTQKSGRRTVDLNLSPRSGFGSSVHSLNEGTQSSSSSDTEFECLDCSSEDNYEIVSDQDAGEDMVDILEGGVTESYEELLMKLSDYQEQLKDSSVKHELSENEVTRLKGELERSNSLAGNLQAQLEYAQEEVKVQEIDLRIKMLEMYDHVTELKTTNSESEKSIEKLTEELEVTKERLKASEKKNAKLKKDISDQITRAANELQHEMEGAKQKALALVSRLDTLRRLILELEEKICNFKTEMCGRDREIQELKDALGDAKENYSLEKMKLQSDMNELETANSEADKLIEKLTVESIVTKEILKASDEENARLKKEILNHIDWATHEVQSAMKKAKEEKTTLESKLDMEKKLVSELQERIYKFEIDMSDRDCEIQELIDALGDATENYSLENMKLEFVTERAQEERFSLESKLDTNRRLISELQERIFKFKTDMSDRDCEIRNLYVALGNANENHTMEKMKLQSDMNELCEKNMHLEERRGDLECRGQRLNNKIAQLEAENFELHNVNGVKKFEMQREINKLKSDLYEMGTQAMQHKSLEEKIAQLEAEKSEMLSVHSVLELEMHYEINKLKADVTRRDANVKALYEDLDRVKLSYDMLEKEVGKERMLVADIAEEKREAIRQLCVTMDYYRFTMEYYRENYLAMHRPFYLRKHNINS